MSEGRIKQWRIGLIGYPFSGKTTLAKEYCDGYHPQTYIPHRNIEVYSGRSDSGQSVFLYEVPGQTQYIELYDVSRLGLTGVVFVFNDGVEATYSRLEYLINFSRKYALEDLPGLVICNNFPEKQSQPHSGPSLASHFSYNYLEMDLRSDQLSLRSAIDILLV